MLNCLRRFVLALIFVAINAAALAAETKTPLVEPYLIAGNLAEGEKQVRARLKEQPQDDEARFSLGVVQFLRAVERLSQNLYRYGLRDVGQGLPIPILRLPIPTNPEPDKLSYAAMRQIAQTLIDDLAATSATLDAIRAVDIKLPLHFGRIRLDLNGDSHIDTEETLWRIFARLNPGAPTDQATAEAFVIGFDKADVYWLCGYCHLLSAMCEFALAYDGRELFERTYHLFFAKVDTPYDFLKHGRKLFAFGDDVDIADLIAFIHLLNFPVQEPERSRAALAHLEAVIAQSRLNWAAIEAETDNEAEWIPGPKQTGVVPGVRITPQMIAAWREFLNEGEAILAGKTLIPFWRANDGRGINLRRVFTEPRQFDLVLWIQGTGAAPYLERGPLTTPEVWQRWQQVFRGQFVGFAIWFN